MIDTTNGAYCCDNDSFAYCVDLANQEATGLSSISSVTQVRSQDRRRENSVTNRVANDTTTEDLELVAGKVRDLLVVGTSLCIAEGDNTGNLVFDTGRKVFDRAMIDGCTLSVSNVNLWSGTTYVCK